MKILIAGYPNCGKTTLADQFGDNFSCTVAHTDDLLELEWSKQSDEVCKWLDEDSPIIIEGVTIPRALRKWLDKNEEGKPADLILFLSNAKEDISDAQLTLGENSQELIRTLSPELISRGVEIVGIWE